MAVIEKKIRLLGSKGEEEVIGLFDSGASYSCIDKDLAARLEIIFPLPEPIPFGTAEKGREIVAKEHTALVFYLDGYRFTDEFFIIANLAEQLIIGVSTMQKWRFKLDFEKEEVIIDPRVTKLRLLSSK